MTSVTPAISLSAIYIYPIKSCRAVSVEKTEITSIGLAGDRRWQVVGTEEERGVTQRKQRSLALIQPSLLEDGAMRLSARGMSDIEIEKPAGPMITVDSHFRIPVSARDAGDEAAEWLTDFIGTPLRLVRMDGDTGWRLPPELDVFGQGAPFTDAAPVLVTSQSSLDWLVSRSSEEFGMDRFRPNFVVKGSDPWAEDEWDRFDIGKASLRGVVPWPRCAIPQIDQQTAERHKEPARVLRKHRWCTSAPSVPAAFRDLIERNSLFGMACSAGPTDATIEVGDRVGVHSTRAPVLDMAL